MRCLDSTSIFAPFIGDEHVERLLKSLSERLLGLYRRTSRPDFPWFEDRLTYCNARLSQALLVSGDG